MGTYNLRRHMKKHLPRVGYYDCPVRGCDRGGERAFPRKDKLNDHMKAKHGLRQV